MRHAKLNWNGTHVELPVLEASTGEKALDIRKLRRQTGVTTYDPGFANTASCSSEITYIDGERSVLRYRGYRIDELARSCGFMDVAYLLLRGTLPTSSDIHSFERELSGYGMPPERLCTWLETLPKETDPMAVLAAAVNVIPIYEPVERNEDAELQLLAYGKGLVATWFRHVKGLPRVESVPNFRWCADLLNMMFATNGGGNQRTQTVFEDAMNLLFLLHADHEQNCSASTARMVASSKASLHAAVSAAIGALSGPRHGGANQAVIEMLEQLARDGGNVGQLLAQVRTGERKLVGFGHRVYKSHDPRAQLLKRAAHDVLERLQHDEPLLELAQELERAALADEYFEERQLFANVDFYSGLIYRALGIPRSMYPMMFALGRLPGWLAQVAELRGQDRYRIHRPRQLYVGPVEKEVPHMR